MTQVEYHFLLVFSWRMLEMATAPDAPITITQYETWMRTKLLTSSINHNRQVRDALAASWQDVAYLVKDGLDPQVERVNLFLKIGVYL